MTKSNLPVANLPIFEVFEVRGQLVVLDARLSESFGIATGRMNETVRRNPAKFNKSHGFQLSDVEFKSLRSQIAISKGTRGGRRYAPYVFTARGVARVATLLNSDQAIQIADLIIDTFMSVQQQVATGQIQVRIEQPDRYRPSDDPEASRALRERLTKALASLLDSVIDAQANMTLRDTIKDGSSKILANVRERLRTKGLENTKLEADTALVLAEAEKIAAEAQRLHAETDGIHLSNIQKRIDIVRQIRDIHKDIEASDVIQLLGAFAGAPQLPGPTAKNTKESK